MKKVKFTIAEQINHLKGKGVKFVKFSEDDARQFLETSNYYFKLKSFSKNFKKHDGLYDDLDFYDLVVLSKIDRLLREIVLSVSLTLEHYMKVELNNHCSKNPQEDGYSIVAKYLDRYGEGDIFSKTSHYNKDLAEKYKREKSALWNIIELMSFKQFVDIYDLYSDVYGVHRKSKQYLYGIRLLRNAAAHSNCLINDLNKIIKEKNNSLIQPILNKAQRYDFKVDKNELRNMLQVIVVHDFSCLLLWSTKVIHSENAKKGIIRKLQCLQDNLNKENFSHNTLIEQTFTTLSLIIDIFKIDFDK